MENQEWFALSKFALTTGTQIFFTLIIFGDQAIWYENTHSTSLVSWLDLLLVLSCNLVFIMWNANVYCVTFALVSIMEMEQKMENRCCFWIFVDVNFNSIYSHFCLWLANSSRSNVIYIISICFDKTSFIVLHSSDKPDENWKMWMYYNPFTRCGPYIVGIIYGYILHIYRNKPLKLNLVNHISNYSIRRKCIFILFFN